MNKRNLYTAVSSAALLLVFILSGCKTTKKTVDEAPYVGTYYGKHYLADSINLRHIVGDENMIYDDTLTVTNGSDATDGKVMAQSTLLGGKSIELDVSSGEVTAAYLGDLVILSTTLKDTKFNTGSTAVWDANKTTVNTHLVASVTYIFGSTPIPITPVTINGVFVKH